MKKKMTAVEKRNAQRKKALLNVCAMRLKEYGIMTEDGCKKTLVSLEKMFPTLKKRIKITSKVK